MIRRFLYIILLSLGTLPLFAQNNIFKIDDTLYPYYVKCTKQVKQKQVLAMSDTLFAMSAKKGDSKAQCLALFLKADYYYTQEDILSLRKAVQDIHDFAVHTPHRQYIFGAWSRIILYYVLRHETITALYEAQAYQQEALQLDCIYGIGFSYRHLGDIYVLQGNSRMAAEYYLKGGEYIEKHGNKGDAFIQFLSAGNAYRSMGDYDKAEKYLLKALHMKVTEKNALQAAQNLVELYTAQGDEEKARYYWEQVERIHPKAAVTVNDRNNYYLVKTKYYLFLRDYERALTVVDSVEVFSQANLKYVICKHLKRYSEALEWKEKHDSLTLSKANEEQRLMLAEYNSRFETNRLEAERNRLALENTEMNLRRMEDERNLLQANQDKNALQLKNTDLALKQQRAELASNRTETLRQKERAAAAEERERLQSIIISVFVLLFICLLVFFMIYSMMRRKSIVRLQKERNMALRARQEAEEANRMKSVFLQNMSHEIRTPLNAIVGFSDVVNSEVDLGLSEEERKEYLDLIHLNTELLTTLVNDVLDVSKLESGTYTLALAEVPVHELCEASLKSIASRVASGVELKLDAPAGVPEDYKFLTDTVRLQQVLTNFLTNACKYTERGSITLGYRLQDNGGITFSVSDTGSGIPADKAEEVFHRFEKLDTFKQGTGLGLSICRKIAELVGGRVYVDTSYTAGARFVFVHPKLTADD